MRHLVFEYIHCSLLDSISLLKRLLTDIELLEVSLDIHHLSVHVIITAVSTHSGHLEWRGWTFFNENLSCQFLISVYEIFEQWLVSLLL